MNTLIIKLGATGDVVRTTPLLGRLGGKVTWITARKNTVLLEDIGDNLRCFCWEDRGNALDTNYDLAINLEDTLEVAEFLTTANYGDLFGAYANSQSELQYTDNSKEWFDLSLISSYGREKADALKLRNRRTYQDLIFAGLGFYFNEDKYRMPGPKQTGLAGDVAIAADAGPIWPMKKWAYFDRLKQRLEEQGLTVNVLQNRPSLLEHLADVANHRCLVGGDSLPMHLALGTGTPCVSIFNCTSPWEIYNYGIQRKIISPLLEEFFYKRGYDERATTAVKLEDVEAAVMDQLNVALPIISQTR